MCSVKNIKLNAGKTKTMIVPRSCTVHPRLTPLTLGGTVLKESADIVILGVTIDSKMTFEKPFALFPVPQLRSRLGIMRKSWQVFYDPWLLLRKSFWSFVLPVLMYCLAVWGSAADS